jgi:hypothetical protein
MTHLSPRAIEAFRRGFKACRPVWRIACQDFGMQQDDLLDQQIEAGLAALEAEGMVVVPSTPTDAMVWAGGSALHDEAEDSVGIYRAMIAAAQGGDDAGAR